MATMTNTPTSSGNATLSLDDSRRSVIQSRWGARREHLALAADADARGVLNFYNMNRSPRSAWRHDPAPLHDMRKEDVANVEFLQMGEVDAVLVMMIDATETQHQMEELHCRWGLGAREPSPAPPRPDVTPFKSATAWARRDRVAFRSKRKQ